MKVSSIKSEDCKWVTKWDYLGWQKQNVLVNGYYEGRYGEPYTQSDWMNTLMTKINQVSAQIHMSTMRGAADTILVHPKSAKFITNQEYYQTDKRLLNGRYKVIQTRKIGVDEVFIGREESFNLKYVSDRIYNTDEYQVVPLRDKYKTDEEVEEYKSTLMGCVKILNCETVKV